jgi:hypothetical protein
MVVCSSITKSVSGVTAVRLSIDNGATFFTASGDYQTVATTGIGTNTDGIALHVTNATGARAGLMYLFGINVTSTFKVANALNTGTPVVFAASSSPINAIRVYPTAGGNLTGGTITVYGR